MLGIIWCRIFCLPVFYPKNIILSVVVYGCETWSLTLREERRLRVFENKELRRIFGPKRDEVTMEWRKLHNEELNDLYSSPHIIRVIKSRRIRWAGNVARMGERCIQGFGGETRRLETIRKSRGIKDNIKMDFQEVGCEGMDCIDINQDRNR